MTARKFMPEATNEVKEFLNQLIDPATDHTQYRAAMYTLGRLLADAALSRIEPDKEICLACTVEDADYLAKGLLDEIQKLRPSQPIRLACFWNKTTFEPFGCEEYEVAPIIKTYQEPVKNKDCILIIVKSIISGACVVATNITSLISDLTPSRILVASPVMLDGAQQKLEHHFSAELVNRFEYIIFAVDNENENGAVKPGVGGNVYQRYGWEGASDKNKAIPELVSARRKQLIAEVKASG